MPTAARERGAAFGIEMDEGEYVRLLPSEPAPAASASPAAPTTAPAARSRRKAAATARTGQTRATARAATTKAAPAKTAPAKAASAKTASAKTASAKTATAKAAPAKADPGEAVPSPTAPAGTTAAAPQPSAPAAPPVRPASTAAATPRAAASRPSAPAGPRVAATASDEPRKPAAPARARTIIVTGGASYAAPEPAAPPGPATTAPAPLLSPARSPAAVPSRAKTTTAAPAATRQPAPDLFARLTRSYCAEASGRQVAILHAGATTASDLGEQTLRSVGADILVSLVEEDGDVTRRAVATRPDLAECTLGDLRTLPLVPRVFDIVQCACLLERIEHAELVLDRLTSAIRPGGLLLLRITDRDSAAGLLDRRLPQLLRRIIWRKRHPGDPGPYRAVYEQVASPRGVQAYALMRGLVIAERKALGGLAGGLPAGPAGYLAAQKLLAWLSRGRLTAAHEQMLYVLRKPESRFARIL